MINEILEYSDIRTRYLNVNNDILTPCSYNIKTLYESFFDRYSYNNAKLIVENWEHLSDNQTISFEMMLDVFNEVCDNEDEYKIKELASLIESRVWKFRGPIELKKLNSYKMGWHKRGNTKAQHQNDANNAANKNAMANNGHVGNSLHPGRKYKYDIFGKRKGEEAKKDDKEEESKENDAKNEAYDNFIRIIDRNNQCDRVLKNHTNLEKRFSFDNIVREYCFDPSDKNIQDAIYEMCKLIDSYQVDFGVKYNVALEEAFYIFHKNCSNVENNIIAESVSDYFLMSRECDEDILHDMKYVLENSHFYNEEDLKNLDYIWKDEAPVSEQQIKVESYLESILNEGKKDKNKEEPKEDTKGILAKFKSGKEKSIGLFKKCIVRCFMNSPKNIVKGLPDIMSALRLMVAVTVTGWMPAIGIPTTIVGFFIKNNIRRSESKKVIEQFKREKAQYEQKLDKAKDDNEREKYQKMVDEMDKSIDKMEDYYRNLHSDRENDERDSKEAENENYIENEYDLDCMIEMGSIINSMNYNSKDVMNTISSNIQRLPSEDIYSLTEALIEINDPAFVNLLEYYRILENELSRFRTFGAAGITKYQRIDALKECMYKVDKVKYDKITEDVDEDNLPNMEDCLVEVKLHKELLDDVIDLVTFNENSIYLEAKDDKKKDKKERDPKSTGHIRNKINSVKQKIKDHKEKPKLSLKSKAQLGAIKTKEVIHKAGDKDREISAKIDANASVVKKSIQQAMTTQNREQIINGTILPSASKSIHYAIAGGVGLAIAPVITIIGAIGTFAMSKRLKRKERQLILDDIEVELEFCDKQLRLAEERNDMKALRQIMQIKRNLQRQQQRIKYNMAVKFNEKIPNKVKSDED